MIKKNTSLSLILRSRTKNMMWYGVLGTKELLQRTYKNLEQKVQLEVWKDLHLPCLTSDLIKGLTKRLD